MSRLIKENRLKKSVSTMVEKALYGGLIAVLIILLFLRDLNRRLFQLFLFLFQSLIALLLLNWLDITLNIMTLGAITVAIGRVIDDSIVVVENIYRRLHLKEEKLTGRALIREATIEMFRPIFLQHSSQSLYLLHSFLLVGWLVNCSYHLRLTMTFALGASLLVAITIVPALSHTLFKKKLYSDKRKESLKVYWQISQLV